MTVETIKIPDIGGAKDVAVIEILVKPGVTVKKGESLLTLESDKATMEVPSPQDGVIKELKMKVGDKANEGDVILLLEGANAVSAAAPKSATVEVGASTKSSPSATQTNGASTQVSTATTANVDVRVPDIGNAHDVDVIEVMVKPGDTIAKDASIVTLESDKASMEIPAPLTGKVLEVKVKVGDKVSQGNIILTLATAEVSASAAAEKVVTSAAARAAPTTTSVSTTSALEKQTMTAPIAPSASVMASAEFTTGSDDVYAGPAVRRLARELGVALRQVIGTGRKGRVQLEDVHQYVKNSLQGGGLAGATAGGLGVAVAAAPKIDFSKFGAIELSPLSKIKRLTGQNTHRSWVTVPHVTQFDEADITDMEAFREAHKRDAERLGYKLTPLTFLMKAVATCLKEFPTFNASLDDSGNQLVLKKYYHVGVAVDTPNGLVVAVIRDVDQKGIYQLAEELAVISKKAREKGLSMTDMQGGCMTISSLGGIGGTAFTPIVNAPEVAILGVSRSVMKPVYIDGEFVPRLMLPLSLSYDHRVIDGALAARFTTHLAKLLGDIRCLLL